MPKILYVEPKFFIVKYKFVNGRLLFDSFAGKFISEKAAKMECDALRKAYFPHCDTSGKAIFRVEREDEDTDVEIY